MSASPTANAVPSTKRPLDDESSATEPTDQPDAKRPALDKAVKEEAIPDAKAEESTGDDATTEEVKTEETKPVANGHTDATGDTVVPDAPNGLVTAESIVETQPIQSTAAQNERSASQGAGAAQSHQDESQWIHVRAVISSAEAATVIGKGGENVSQIRRLSGAKCTVSDYSRGAVERILTVSGLVDAVAKAFGLIIRTLNNEPLEAPSTPQSKTYPLRLLVPHILIGSIIGKQGVRIREIQDASGARLNASDSCLPNSTERSLVVLGVADAVHIATYYVGQTLVDQLTERFGGPAASAYATRSGGPAGVVPGGMQVVPYVPQPAGGQFGNPQNFKRHDNTGGRTPANPYGVPYLHGQPPQQQQPPQTPTPYGQQPAAYGAAPHQPHVGAQPTASHAGPPQQPMQGVGGGQPLTQQIFIPNDMVGAIIGKGGAKINEIRQLSGSVIKINEPQDNSNERLVTITGTQECNQMALYMLYSRLGMCDRPVQRDLQLISLQRARSTASRSHDAPIYLKKE
jgi:heterogeneous nuclear rnp K-like protein 2